MKLNGLIVIAPEYYSFVKDQTEAVSHNFRKIQVFVRHNPLVEISRFIPLKSLDNFRLSRRINLKNLPDNIHIIPTPVYYIPLNCGYKSAGIPHYRRVCKSIVLDDLKDNAIVHAHHIWSAGYVGARLKEEYGIPFVVTGHGYDVYLLPFKDSEWRERIEYVLNAADHIITVSKSNLACIKKLDISTPVTVIPNGFRTDLFYPREPHKCRQMLNLPQEKKIILTIGNIVSVKGQRYLIEAIEKVLQERKDIFCIIVGSGELRTKLERQIRSLGLEDYVTLAGGKPHDEIPIWINACDVFVLPSLNEGNPTVMFEALGCGKPFVGTRVGGVPEVIISEDYGLLVEPGDPKDLAEKILIALDKEWKREKILRYAEQYTWENIAKDIISIYTKILNSSINQEDGNVSSGIETVD